MENIETFNRCRKSIFEKTSEHHEYHLYINDTRPSAWITQQLHESSPSAMYNLLKRCRNNPMFEGFYQEDFANAIKYAREGLQVTLNLEQASVELNLVDVSNEVLNGYTWVDCLMCLLSLPLYVPIKQRLDTTPPTKFVKEVRENIQKAHPKMMEGKHNIISVDDITREIKCLWQVKQRTEKEHYQKLVPVHGLAYRDTPAGYKAILDIGKNLIKDKKVVKSMQLNLSILHTLLNDPKYYAQQLNFTGTTAASYHKKSTKVATTLQGEREKVMGFKKNVEICQQLYDKQYIPAKELYDFKINRIRKEIKDIKGKGLQRSIQTADLKKKIRITTIYNILDLAHRKWLKTRLRERDEAILEHKNSVKIVNSLKSISVFLLKKTQQWTAEYQKATIQLKKAEFLLHKLAPSIWLEQMQQKRWFSSATREVGKNPVMALSFIHALFGFGYNSNTKDMKNLFLTHRFGFHSEDWSTHTSKFLTMFFAIHINLDSSLESETNKKSLIVDRREDCKFVVCFVCFCGTCGTCGTSCGTCGHKKINRFSPSPP